MLRPHAATRRLPPSRNSSMLREPRTRSGLGGIIMLTRTDSYADLYASFRWQIPDFYSIAADTCDCWAGADPERIALIDRRADGRMQEISYRTLREKANRLANALASLTITRGDWVAILLPQMLFAYLAIYKLAAIPCHSPRSSAWRHWNTGSAMRARRRSSPTAQGSRRSRNCATNCRSWRWFSRSMIRRARRLKVSRACRD